MLAPMIPATAETIFAQLGTSNTSFESIGGEFNGTEVGTCVNDSAVLFARIDEQKTLETIYAEIEAAKKAAEASKIEKPEGCSIIGFEDFMKVELRVAKITACEKVPKAKKLLKLQVDLGYEQRQIVSGIAKFYEPEALIGKKIIVVANLAPATLCGIESQGMLLAASSEAADSKIRVVFLADDTPLGDRIR